MDQTTPCPCPKKKCERHGDCRACREHHAGRKLPCYCERGKARPKLDSRPKKEA